MREREREGVGEAEWGEKRARIFRDGAYSLFYTFMTRTFMHSLLRNGKRLLIQLGGRSVYREGRGGRRSRLEVNGCLDVNSLSFLFRFSLTSSSPFVRDRTLRSRSLPSPIIKIHRGTNHLVNRIRIDRVSRVVYHVRWPTCVSREKLHKMERLY